MKTIIISILCIILLMYSSGLTIKLSPFKILLPNWMVLVGSILIIIGICFINVHFYRVGQADTLKEIIECIENTEDKHLNN